MSRVLNTSARIVRDNAHAMMEGSLSVSGLRGFPVFEVLRNPGPVLEATGRERRVGAGTLTVGLWAVMSLVLTASFLFGGGLRADQFPELSPEMFAQLEGGLRVFVPFSAVLFPFVWWLGVAALMHLTVRLFGGRASLASMLAVVGMACAPWVAGYLVQIPLGLLQFALEDRGAASTVIGALGFVVSAGALVWHAILVVLGAGLVAGISYQGAGASCALTGLGCAVAAMFLGITLLTLFVALSSTAGTS